MNCAVVINITKLFQGKFAASRNKTVVSTHAHLSRLVLSVTGQMSTSL